MRLVQCQLETDHFAGLDRALAERWIGAERVFPDQPPLALAEGTPAVVLSDTLAGMNALAHRQARRVGARVVLVMDGIVEYRNTFVNGRARGVFVAGDEARGGFLRPAPADVVACCGEIDRRVLEALGNRAEVTGLPRLGGMSGIPRAPERRAVLVATANQPWFSDAERERVVASLRELKGALERMGVEAVWRLRADLDGVLGVESDRRALRVVMGEVPAVITTASTLMVEAMLAGRATGIMHPHPTALWQPAAWGWRGVGGSEGEPDMSAAATELEPGTLRELRRIHDEARAMTAWFDDAESFVGSLLARGDGMMDRQRECARKLCADTPGTPVRAADRVAAAIERAVGSEARGAGGCGAFPTVLRQGARRASTGRPVVVSLVVCDDTPVGGVLTWSRRLGDAFAREDLGYDVRTLMVCAAPDVWRWKDVRVELDPNTDLCVIDPLADQVDVLARVREGVERLAGGVPSVVIPNYTDLAYAVAMQLRAHGTRTIAVAHTDERYYQDLMSTYHMWEGAVAVSGACMEWVRGIEEATRPAAPGRRGPGVARPLECIPCAAPVDASARAVAATGPLKIAYVGRMVQVQKRISDLLLVVDGLEARGAEYELHMVGDGVDLPAWRTELARRALRHGKVVLHGRREHGWVEGFIRTMDVSVLVSEFEGTSVSMLEAMGAGVVPAVTAVRSGVGEWVRDGENGIVVPVGQPDEMAARLAALAGDRGMLARLSRSAWERVRRDGSVEGMARRYRSLFDEVRAYPMDRTPTDLGVRLIERWRWSKDFAEDAAGARERVAGLLYEAGYTKIAYDVPEPGCDVVVVRTDERPLSRVQAAQVALWRACGLGVVTLPHLRQSGIEDLMGSVSARTSGRCRALVGEAAAQGCGRIAVYGTGKHTRRLAELFDGTLPFVGFIDDNPPAWEYMFGLPIVRSCEAIERLRPDAVLLSSDAWEAKMWEETAGMRRAGIRVIPVYGTYDVGPVGEAKMEDAAARAAA